VSDQTDPTAPADEDLLAPQPETEGPRSGVSRHASRLFGAAALLSTTALLPIIEPKTPPYKAD